MAGYACSYGGGTPDGPEIGQAWSGRADPTLWPKPGAVGAALTVLTAVMLNLAIAAR